MSLNTQPGVALAAPALCFANGNTIKILSDGRASEGRLTVIDYVDRTQGNPPPFTRHDFSEVFSVLAGRLAFQYEGEALFYLKAGDTVTVPCARSHTFWNPDATPLHLILACSPAGLERFFEELHALLERLASGEIDLAEKDRQMDALRVKYGIEQTAPAPTLV